MRIDIVHATAGELIELLGAAADPEFVPWLCDAGPEVRVCAAVMRQGDTSTLVDAYLLPDGRALVPRGDLFHYHWWHAEQASVNFWQAAYSWTLYWNTVFFGERGDPGWMDQIMTPLASPPMLGFLDVSCGRIAWGFQLEMAYRLGDGDLKRAVEFRKGWTAQLPDAVERAKMLRLPDGSTLYETIDAHPAHQDLHFVVPVPMRAAHLLLKA